MEYSMLIDASVWDALLCYADLHVSSDGEELQFWGFGNFSLGILCSGIHLFHCRASWIFWERANLLPSSFFL